MRLDQCHNFQDFRLLAKKRLPSPVFNYIDGAADDEITYQRNTQSFNDIDLVPNVLAGVENINLKTTIFGKTIDMPIYCAPTAVQRLFHHEGERAVAKAAEKYGTMFGISSLSTVSVEEINALIKTPKMFQFYFHKDRGLNKNMLAVGGVIHDPIEYTQSEVFDEDVLVDMLEDKEPAKKRAKGESK